MAVFSINCPDCKAVLKSPKPVPPGKAITCPKCQVKFVTPAPQPVASVGVELVEDDEEIIEDVEVVEEPKKVEKKRSQPGQVRKKKKKPKSNTPLIIGLCVGLFAVTGLAAGGYFGVKWLLAENTDPIVYVPDKAQIVFGLNVNRLGDTPLGPLLDTVLASSPEFKKYADAVGGSPRGLIDQLVVGMTPKSGYLPTVSSVAVSRTPFDKAKMTAALGGTAATFGGRNVIQVGQAPAQQNVLIGERVWTTVTGAAGDAEDAIKTAGRNRPEPNIAEIVSRASKADIFIVMNPNAPGLAESMAQGGAMVPGAPKLDMQVLNNLKCIGVWAKVNSSEMEIHVNLLAYEPTTASKMVEDAKKAFEAMKANPGGAPPELVESLTVKNDGSLVEGSGKVKMGTIQPYIAQAQALMGLANLMPKPPAGGGGRGGGRW